MGRQGCQFVQDVLKTEQTGQSGGKRKNIFTGGETHLQKRKGKLCS